MTKLPVQRAAVAQQLTAAANELRALRARPGVNQRVLDLLEAELREGGSRLAGVDLLAAYPPEVLVTERPSGPVRSTTLLAAVRDLLVFAPIAITWWSLRDVLGAWSKANYQGNLLQYWQTAPEGVTKLSDAAFYVVAVLVLVAVLTFVILWRERQLGDSSDTRERLTAALAAAGLALAPRNEDGRVSARRLTATAGQIATSTGQLVGTLQRVGADLHTVANAGPGSELHAALQEWRQSAAALAQLGKGLTAPAKMVEDLVRLRASAEEEEARLRRAIQTLAERLEESTTVAVREGLGHTQVADEIRRSTQELGRAVDRFLHRTDSLEVLVAQVQGLLVRLETHGFFPPYDGSVRDNGDDGRGR